MLLLRSLLLCVVATSYSSAALAGDAFERREAVSLGAVATTTLERLAGNASVPFRVVPDMRGDRCAAITGGRILVDGEDPASRAVNFFREYGGIFGLTSTVELRPIAANTFDDRVTLELYLDGLRIVNVLARIAFDGDSVQQASLRAPISFATAGTFDIAATDAVARASAAIDAHRANRGKVGELTPAKSEKVWLPTVSGLIAAYRVDRNSVRPGEAWRTYVDAANGDVTGIIDRIRHAEKGNLPIEFDGSFITFSKFQLGDANGRVFSSQNKAIIGLSSKKTLKNFAIKGAPNAGVAKGFIFGRVANVFDFFSGDPFEPSLLFDYDPFSAETLVNGIPLYDAFDCVNIEYQLEIFYAHLLKQLGKSQLASNLSVPVIVNSPTNETNAFFSPTEFPPMNPTTVGFMEFFDRSSFTNDVRDDLARDPVVACHEYTHAWLFYEQLPFEDELDFPPRAVGEAIPDFFATTLHKDNVVGRYTGTFISAGPLRVLQDDDHFPETTQGALYDQDPGAPVVILPEEHENGEVFGSLLLDARDNLGAKRMEQIVFAAMSSMPHNMADVGFSTNDVIADPIAATERYFFECAAALLSEANNDKESGAIFGAGLGRGVFQNSGLFSLLLNLENSVDRKMTIPTVIPLIGGANQISFRAKQGRKLKITIVADGDSTLIPSFSLASSTGAMDAFTFNDPATTSADQKTIVQGNITLNLPLGVASVPGDPFYVLTVQPSSGVGYYAVTLDA